VKWSEGLRKRVSIIIRRYADHMKFYCFFIFLWFYCVSLYIWLCVLCVLFNFVYFVFLLLCMFRSMYCVLLCCSVYCLCVNVYCTTATRCQPNCSYQIYHMVSYIISYTSKDNKKVIHVKVTFITCK